MPEKQILDSWKEIAAYLNRTVRTCQRWESELELPIYRLDGSPKANVFAYKEELDRWLEGTLHTKWPQKKKFHFLQATKFKWIFGFISSLLLLGLIALVYKFVFSPETALASFEKPSIAVLYFENSSGDRSLDNWKMGIAELLITDLSQSKFLTVLSSDRTYSMLKKLNLLDAQKYTSEDLRTFATESKVQYLLTGALLAAGGKLVVTSHLLDPKSNSSIWSNKVECQSEEEIFERVDFLTQGIKKQLNIPPAQIADDIDENIGRITTKSADAFQYYIEGRMHYKQADFPKAISAMLKAVDMDPEFAMAYSGLAAGYASMGYTPERLFYMQKALDYSDRVSLRERLRIQVWAEKSKEGRMDLFNKILEYYPDDLTAHVNIGIFYIYLEEWEKAKHHLQFGIDRKTDDFIFYSVMLDVYRAAGHYDTVEKILDYYKNNHNDNYRLHRSLANNHICLGQYSKAHEEIDSSISMNDKMVGSHRLKGDIYLLQGDWDNAQTQYQWLTESEDVLFQVHGTAGLWALHLLKGQFIKAQKSAEEGIASSIALQDKIWAATMRLNLAQVYLNSGNPLGCLEECSKSDAFVEAPDAFHRRQIRHRHLIGLSQIQLGSLENARKAVKELEKLAQENQRANRFSLHLKGMIEFAEGDLDESRELLEKANSLLLYQGHEDPREIHSHHALFINSLGSLYLEIGQYSKALEHFKRITQLTNGRFSYGDIYIKSYYMLGKIYEEQGKTKRAISYYNKFLSLWKDADPDIEEVRDAKIRLRRLTSS